ncbi:DNA polymerase III subunit gamma/tau [Tumebacillus lipolyticus]|uniref:DNA polymerase III subunit gamma/tau n=1 Tax=Tumebacillus lipolyticus TaxID=1280370 RepID=A0ABW4ZU06_9BACL
MNHLITAYFDLLGINSLLLTKGSKKFTAAPIHVLARNVCLIIYQIHHDILGEIDSLDKDYKKIRNKVHLHQKKNNKKVYNEILSYHVARFGDDIDNIGFYLDGTELAGSTVYPTYVFYDTTFYKSSGIETKGEDIIRFFTMTGELSANLMEKINELANGQLPLFNQPSLFYDDVTSYEFKDVHWSLVFSNDEAQNVLTTRLLLIAQEATTCIWLGNALQSAHAVGGFNKYILLRFISISMDEIMDNLMNMKKHMKPYYDMLDKHSNGRVSYLTDQYSKGIQEECQILRNMLHYDEKGQNYWGYIQIKLHNEPSYVDFMIENILHGFLDPISKIISNYFDIHNKRSLSDWEKIVTRLRRNMGKWSFRQARH